MHCRIKWSVHIAEYLRGESDKKDPFNNTAKGLSAVDLLQKWLINDIGLMRSSDSILSGCNGDIQLEIERRYLESMIGD